MIEPATNEELERQYLEDERPRPWLCVNMVASVDGGTQVDGRSSSIGDRQDTVVFRALRAVADVVLVAAATVRAEGYGAADLPDHLVRWRHGEEMANNPRIAIVSGSLDIDLDAFGADPPIVVTTESAPTDRLRHISERTDVVIAGQDRVDLGNALRQLRSRGLARVLSEGGPSLNGQLAMSDLVDEWCLTISPVLLSGESKRVVSGPGLDEGRSVVLDRVLRGEQSVFTRWLRQPGSG